MLYLFLVFATLDRFGAFATVLKEHVNIRDLDGFVCQSTETAFSVAVLSETQCVAECLMHTSCKNVFYNSETSLCTGCSVFYTQPSSSLTMSDGTRYYTAIDADPACNTPVNHFRLCDGSGSGVKHSRRGRIEILYNRTWWAVCDDCWKGDCPNPQDPGHNLNTICGTFGYIGVSIVDANQAFGTNTRDLLIENVECTDTETSLWDCPLIGPPSTIACNHDEAVGVYCE